MAWHFSGDRTKEVFKALTGILKEWSDFLPAPGMASTFSLKHSRNYATGGNGLVFFLDGLNVFLPGLAFFLSSDVAYSLTSPFATSSVPKNSWFL